MKFSAIQQAILREVIYAEVFHRPVHLMDIWKRLPAIHASESEVYTSVLSLISNNTLYLRDGYVARSTKLLGRINHWRDTQKKLEVELWMIQRFFGAIPGIVEVYLTGSVAAGLPDEDHDLDFMIVTKPQMVWIVRILVAPIVILIGKYAPFHQEKDLRGVSTTSKSRAGAWCLNLWTSSDVLEIPKERRSLYTAHEVVLARPLLHRDQNPLLEQNSWVRSYFPNLKRKKFLEKSSMPLKGILGKLLTILNRGCFSLQYQYMKRHRTIERVTIDSAFFHPRKTSRLVMNRYSILCQRSKIEP